MDKNPQLKVIEKLLMTRLSLTRLLNNTNLKPGEFMVLRYLITHPPHALNSDLASHLTLPAPLITRIINQLEEYDLVKRQIDLKNRRNILITITDSGRKIYYEAISQIANYGNDLLTVLSIDEINQFLKTLSIINEHFNNFEFDSEEN